MTEDEISKKLKKTNLSDVSLQTGISRQTLWRLKTNKSRRVSYNTIKRLFEFFEEN